MAKIESFEDIDAWKKARELASGLYRLTRQSELRRDFGLKDQLRRAAVSVMANIAEGFGRKTNKDFANFLYTAKASAMEVVSHLYVALDQEYVAKEEFDTLKSGYDNLVGQLIGFIRYLEEDSKRKRF